MAASSSRRMPLLLLAFAPLVSACLAAFAPAVFARREHTGMRRTSPSTECLACHPTEQQARDHATAPDAAPTVAAWMTDDGRGCLGCHAVLGAR